MLFFHRTTNASAFSAIKAAAPTLYMDLFSLDNTIKPLAKSFSLSVTTTAAHAVSTAMETSSAELLQ